MKEPQLPVQERQEARARSPGREEPLEKEMATHSRILAWDSPCTEEPGGSIVHGVVQSQA